MPPQIKKTTVSIEATQNDKVQKQKEARKKRDKLFHDTKIFLQSYRRLELSLQRSKAMQMKRLAANDTSHEWNGTKRSCLCTALFKADARDGIGLVSHLADEILRYPTI